jgi:hypothetical protein
MHSLNEATCPGTGQESERFGNSSYANGAHATALGFGATSDGEDATATGHSSVANGVGSVANGKGASATYDRSMAFGAGATATAMGQIVFGSGTYHSTDVYFGKGVTHASPVAVTIHGTGGSGSDVAGADLIHAAGRGTGSAPGGSYKIQTAPAGSSGSSLNTLVDRVVVSSAGVVSVTGSVTVTGAVQTGAELKVMSASPLLWFVDTTATDTGFFVYCDAGKLRIAASTDAGSVTSTAMTVDRSNGHVGFGTTSPTSRLHVVGGDLRIQSAAPFIWLTDTTTADTGFFIYCDGGILRIASATDAGGVTAQLVAIDRTAGDVEVVTADKGLILKSPDGTRYRIKVANGGTINISAA